MIRLLETIVGYDENSKPIHAEQLTVVMYEVLEDMIDKEVLAVSQSGIIIYKGK